MSARAGIVAALAFVLMTPTGAQEAEPDWDEDWRLAEEWVRGTSSPEELEWVWEAYAAKVLPEDLFVSPTVERDEAEVQRIHGAAYVLFIAAHKRFKLGADAATSLRCFEAMVRSAFVMNDLPNIRQSSIHLAHLYVGQGDDEAARNVLEKCLARLPGDDPGRGVALARLADIERRQRRWESARTFLDEARSLVVPGSELGPELWFLEGQLALDQGLLEQARTRIDAGRTEAAALGGRLVTVGWVLRANYLVAAERWNDLVHEVEGALAEESSLFGSQPANRASLLVRLGRAYVELARDDPAHVPTARDHLSRVLEDGAARALTLLGAEQWLAVLELHSGSLDEAQAWVESARNRLSTGVYAPKEHAFVDALESRIALCAGQSVPDDVAHRLSASVDRMLAAWMEQPEFEGGVGYLHYPRRQFVIGQALALALLQDPGERGIERALELLVRAQSAGSLPRALDADGASWTDMRRALVPPGGGLLVFFPSAEEGHVFAVDHERLLHAPLASRRSLLRPVRELLRWIYRPVPAPGGAEAELRRSEIERLARDVGALLFPPSIAAAVEGWDGVSIIGADLLSELPFEALRLPSGESFGRTKAVSYLPSLPVGWALHRRTARAAAIEPDADVCLVTRTLPSKRVRERFPHVGELSIDDADLSALTRAFDPGRTTLLVGRDATLGEIAARAPGARLLHVLTHGVWDPTRDRPVGLVLTPGRSEDEGLCFADDVVALRSPPLVFLTACSSGAEPQRRGDAGAAGLNGAFLRAGAQVLVSATTDLPLRPSLELVEAFQHELVRGATPAEALRRARCALADSADWEDPAQSALLRVFGQGHEPVFEARAGASRILAVVSLVLGAAALLFLTRKRLSRAATS